MHQNRSLSTFLTPFDHFQKRVFGKLISWHLPRCCHIKFCFCVFMTTRISHDASKTCLGMWRISFMFARLWKLLTFLSCILFPLLSQNFVNISCLTFSFVLLFWRRVDVYVVASAANRARCVTDAYVFWQGADDVAKHKLQAIVLQLVRRHPVLSPVKYETNPILHQGGEGLDHDGGSHGGDEGHSHRWRAFKYPCTNWRSHTHGVFLFSDRNIPLITKFLNRNMSDKYSEVDLTS